MAFSIKSFPLALGFTSLLSQLSSIYPRSLFPQTSSFSPSLGLDSSESDQAVSSLDVSPDVSLQIFRTDIPGLYCIDLSRDDSIRDRSMWYASGISACIEYNVSLMLRMSRVSVMHRWRNESPAPNSH